MIPAFTISDEEYWDGDGTIVYLNPDNIVAVEPTKVTLYAYSDEWRREIEASRIITNAATGTYTHKNDPYDAWRHGLPEVETRGGGCITYVVPLDRAAVAAAIHARNPIRYTKETMAHIAAYRQAKDMRRSAHP